MTFSAGDAVGAVAALFGAIGAILAYHFGTQGPGLPFYDDAAGTIRAQIAAIARRRQRWQRIGLGLVLASAVLQVLALGVD